MLSLTNAEAGKPGGITLDSVNNKPVKELTDEEILQQALFSFGNESENFDDSYWIGFARAILRKAQGD